MEGQDEQAQKAQIFRNNYQLWQGNSMTAPEKSERESGRDVAGFNFKLKLPASKDGTTLQKGGGKKGDKGKSAGSAGFRIGARDEIDDYRAAALRGRGLDCGVTSDGQFFLISVSL